MRIIEDVKLDFCDVLFVPKRSDSPSRSSVELKRKYTFLNSKKTWEGTPVIAANMDTVGTFSMTHAMAKREMAVALHKHYTETEIEIFYNHNPHLRNNYFYSLGITDNDFAKIKSLKNRGFDFPLINLDVANGYTNFFVKKCSQLRELFPESIIMAGNICTPEMVQELLMNGGVDIAKIGIGGGSACITRKVAGVGYPQLSAVIECSDAAHGLGGHICSDGGCQLVGDVSKAFGGGADFVMLGGLLSGYEECSGDWEIDSEGNKKSLSFWGMSSKEANDKYSGGTKGYRAAEGKKVSVPYKGHVEPFLIEIEGGLRSTCTYVGTNKLKDLSKCTTFVRVNRTHNTVFGY